VTKSLAMVWHPDRKNLEVVDDRLCEVCRKISIMSANAIEVNDSVTKTSTFQPPIIENDVISMLIDQPVTSQNEMIRCLTCNKFFESYEIMDQHKKAEHGFEKGIFGCVFCSETFATNADRKLHVAEKHRNFVVTSCVYCSKQFESPRHMHVHVSKFHKTQAIKCWQENCLMYFLDEDKRNEHVLMAHDQRMNIMCHCCGKIFGPEELVKHRRAVEDKKNGIHNGCEICGYYCSSTELVSHVTSCISSRSKANPYFEKAVLSDFKLRKTAANEVNKTGIIFDATFLKDETLSEAIWAVEELYAFNHSMKNSLPKIECFYCFQEFSGEVQLQHHALQEHNIPHLSLPFRKFLERFDILERIELLCPHCGKPSTAKSLRVHLMPKQCAGCRRIKILCQHAKKCTRRKLQSACKCLYCPMQFANSTLREEHSLVKHPLKCFQCPYCDFIFIKKTVRMDHIRQEHTAVAIKCSYSQCFDFFRTLDERDKHVRALHTTYWNTTQRGSES